MATLRPLPVPQDENDVVHGHRVKFDGSNDGPGFPSGKGLGGARTGGGAFSKTPGKGLASGRKALGDISNRTGELGGPGWTRQLATLVLPFRRGAAACRGQG